MLLEGLLFGVLVLVILVFFYKQAKTDFEITQIDSLDKLPKLLTERNPIVLQPFDVPKQLWTHEDIKQRSVLGSSMIPTLNIPVRNAMNFPNASISWSQQYASDMAEKTGLPVWAEQVLRTSLQSKLLFSPLYSFHTEVYLGAQGLQKTFGVATFFVCTEGTAVATILNEASDPYLPPNWKGKRLSKLTRNEAPLIGQIQCIDVVLRPGSALILPPHWKLCMEQQDDSTKPVCLVKITMHHPISKLVEKAWMSRQT